MKRDLESRRESIVTNIEESEGIRSRPVALNTVDLLKVCS